MMSFDTGLLAPAAVLAAWTMVMLLWMAATRLPAMKRMGAGLDAARPGGRGQDIDARLPAQIAWKSHNFTHLHEQPTVFYALCVILTLAGGVSTLTVGLAWAYTGLRIIHSLWQSLVNTLPVRATLFLASSVCLIGLALLAVIATLG